MSATLPTVRLPRAGDVSDIREEAPPDSSDQGSPPAGPPRPTKRGGGRRRLLLVTLAVVVGFVAAVWIVAFSPVLGVSKVRVTGLHYLSAAQVRTAADVSNGTPLVRLDTGAIARRIEGLRVVASVQVHTSYPNTVVIDVTERVAVGYLEDGTRFALVDRDGVQFRTVANRPTKLPLFSVQRGDQAQSSAAAIAGVAAALSKSMLARIASIQAFDPNAITLVFKDAHIVTWGSADRSADKARLLPTLLRQPGTQINLTNPDQVVVR